MIARTRTIGILPPLKRAFRAFHADGHVELLNLGQIPDLPTAKTVELSHRVYAAGKHTEIGHTTKFQGPHSAPVVMVHGLFGNKQNWVSVGKRITQITGRLVVGVDARNHGDSPHSLPHDYLHLTHDLIRFLERMRADAGNEFAGSDGRKPNWKDGAVLVGHSMGAKVVMLASLLRPDLVSRLVVIDNAPASQKLDVQFLKDLIGMARVEVEQHQLTEKVLHKHQLKAIDRILAEYEPNRLVRVFLMSNLDISTHDKTSVITFKIPVLNLLKHNVYETMGLWPDTAVEGLQFRKPVLIMRGLQSPFVSDSHLQQTFPQYFEHTSTADFDAGHWLVSEQPDRFVKEVVQFLSK